MIRPYRLHVLLVPALRVAADVLRGSRRYPMSFDWLLPTGVYAPMRCPSCSAEAALVAGKEKLGCEACLSPKPPTAAAAKPTAGKPASAVGSPRPPSRPRPPSLPWRNRPLHSRQQRGNPASVGLSRPRCAGRSRRPDPALAERVWSAVAGGDRRTLARVVHPDSPAAALARVYGPAAFTGIIGMPASEAPERFTAAVDAQIVHGMVLGSSGAEYRYFIPCQDGQAAEVLPFPVTADGAFWNFYWSGRRPDARSSVPAVGDLIRSSANWPSPGVTGTASQSPPAPWRHGIVWTTSRDRLLSAHPSAVLGACVIRLVAYRAGGKATFASVADHFRLPEEDVRRADRAVRPLLALGPCCPW